MFDLNDAKSIIGRFVYSYNNKGWLTAIRCITKVADGKWTKEIQ